MKKKIVTDIAYLRTKSVPVEPSEVENIVKDLEDSLDLKRGMGLSAIQIGVNKRVGIIRLGDKQKTNLINPVIISKENRIQFKGEGCLSIPGLYINTARYNTVVIENGFDRRQYVLEGYEAFVCQHEINHMDGKLIVDKELKWRKR